MKIKELVSALERFAPLPLQDGFDNAGLQIGLTDAEATGGVPFYAVPGGQTAGKGQQHGRTDNRNRIPYKTVMIWQSKAAGNRK